MTSEPSNHDVPEPERTGTRMYFKEMAIELGKTKEASDLLNNQIHKATYAADAYYRSWIQPEIEDPHYYTRLTNEEAPTHAPELLALTYGLESDEVDPDPTAYYDPDDPRCPFCHNTGHHPAPVHNEPQLHPTEPETREVRCRLCFYFHNVWCFVITIDGQEITDDPIEHRAMAISKEPDFEYYIHGVRVHPRFYHQQWLNFKRGVATPFYTRHGSMRVELNPYRPDPA